MSGSFPVDNYWLKSLVFLILWIEKVCKNQNCSTNKIKSNLEKEIKLAILKKATLIEKEGFQKYYETKGKNKVGQIKNE